jgi:hypothetical protein
MEMISTMLEITIGKSPEAAVYRTTALSSSRGSVNSTINQADSWAARYEERANNGK